MINLINNSIKFTSKGSIIFGCEKKGEYLQFSVQDTGIGIPEAYHEMIFERFIQADLSLSKGFEGAGLGLAICKGFVELLGGKIWLQSERNLGTTFFFTIPLKQSKNTQNAIVNELKIDGTLKPTKILIVEDDFASYHYLTKVLKNKKYELLYAENGLQAIKLISNIHDIDLVLMDIKMPVMDGLKATIEIKKIKPDLPIIAQTAYAFREEKKEFLMSGFTDYISKPIKYDALISIIEKYT